MEIWKDIENFEGKYQISNLGNVKSLHYYGGKREHIMKPAPDKDGYLCIGLKKSLADGKDKSLKVHRLVAQAFIPNPNNYSQINHKDENNQNNFVDNLEWCNAKYNCNYGTHTEKIVKSLTGRRLTEEHKRKIKEGSITKRKVSMFSIDGEKIKDFTSATEAGEYVNGVCTNIVACCKGRIKTYKGYIFRYSEN